MNSTRILTLAAAAAAISASALAQGTFNYNDRDIIAVFTKSGGPDVAVDLGSPESFDTHYVDFTASAGFVKYNATSQLLSIYGGSLSGVQFTIFGSQKNTAGADSVSTAQRTSWLSVAESTAGIIGGPYNGFSPSGAASLNANVTTAVGYPGGTTGFKKIASDNAVNAVSNNGTVLVTQQADNDYTAYGFSSKNQPNNSQKLGIYATKPAGTALQNDAGGTSDFYQFPTSSSSSATFLGTFHLDQTTGVLSYSAVPEPGEYAAIAGGALLAGAMIRRRFQKR